MARGAALIGYGVLGRTLQCRAGLLARMGRLPEARVDAGRAVAMIRPRGEPEVLCRALAMLPLVSWLTGESTDHSETIREAIQMAEDTGNAASLVLSLEWLALNHLTAGSAGAAVRACERALSVGREKRSGLFVEASVLAHLAQARLAAGEHSNAAALADEAVEVSGRQGARVHKCSALLTRARVGRVGGRPADAVAADLDAGLALVAEVGALTYEPFMGEERARLRSDQAELREALRLYESIGATGHARSFEAELAESESVTSAGHSAGAAPPMPR
jgi:tetratricopeptide (TPR) repeat protein